MKIEKITTLGQLKKSGYISKSIKDELRDNLILKIGENAHGNADILQLKVALKKVKPYEIISFGKHMELKKLNGNEGGREPSPRKRFDGDHATLSTIVQPAGEANPGTARRGHSEHAAAGKGAG